MSIIEIVELTKDYPRGFLRRGRIRALDRVSTRIEPGASVAVLGPNGSGKSTFLKIIMGFVRPGGGSVTVFGVRAGHPSAMARIGYMPETLAVPHTYTARHVLVLAARLAGRTPPEGTERETNRLLDISGLNGAVRRRVGRLSKGMARRLCFAQACASDPELLLLDEPFDGIDIEGRRSFKDRLLDMRRRGAAIVLSTHAHADVEELCDTVLVIHRGKLRARIDVRGMNQGPGTVFTIPPAGECVRELDHCPGVHLRPVAGVLEIDAAGAGASETVLRFLVRESIPILSMRQTGSTLEQVYLSVCKEGENEDTRSWL